MRTVAAALVLSLALVAQTESDKRTFSGVQRLVVDNIAGPIEVTAHNRAEVEMEVVKEIRASSPEERERAAREVKLDIQQSGETLRLYVDGPFRCNCNCDCGSGRGWRGWGYEVLYTFRLKVPPQTSVDVRTVNHGHVMIEGVTGDFQAHNVNGRIELSGMGGSGAAGTVNGGIVARFARNPPGNLSLGTVNGSVDATFLPGLSADVNSKTLHGEVYTDFDISASPGSPTVERVGSRYRYGRKGVGFRIGSGGPEFAFKTINGDIFIRSHRP